VVSFTVCVIVYLLFMELNRFLGVNGALLGLAKRLHRRAVSLSVQSFLELAEFALEHGFLPPSNDLHITLHRVLAQIFQNRMNNTAIYRTVMFATALSMFFINATLFSTTGSCFPAFVIATLPILGVFLTFELIHFSLSNQQVDAISLLYLEARDELLLHLAQPGHQADHAIKTDLRSQAELLGSLADCERYKAQLLGFVIGFGVLRALLATLITLGVALLSILRNAGICVTIQSYCFL